MPAVRIASLVLASEALWWLGHFKDARRAAQAAADADPASAQALWRLAVALYRLGLFDQAGKRLDDLLRLASRFAPGWALRGQVKVWLEPDNPEAGGADFAAAAALTSDSGTWVVPYRMAGADFQAQADAQIRAHDSETGGSAGSLVDVVLLPDESQVQRGVDPDRRWHLEGPGPGGGDSGSLFGPLGGDFAAGHARASASETGSFFISGTSRTSARTRQLSARRSGSRWPSFSTRLSRPTRRSPSRVRPSNTPKGQTSHGMRTTSTTTIGITSLACSTGCGQSGHACGGASPGAGSVRAAAAGPASAPGHPSHGRRLTRERRALQLARLRHRTNLIKVGSSAGMRPNYLCSRERGMTSPDS